MVDRLADIQLKFHVVAAESRPKHILWVLTDLTKHSRNFCLKNLIFLLWTNCSELLWNICNWCHSNSRQSCKQLTDFKQQKMSATQFILQRLRYCLKWQWLRVYYNTSSRDHAFFNYFFNFQGLTKAKPSKSCIYWCCISFPFVFSHNNFSFICKWFLFNY